MSYFWCDSLIICVTAASSRYDPTGKFHAHAHDMVCLEQWMAEMLDLHRGSAGKLDGGGCER